MTRNPTYKLYTAVFVTLPLKRATVRVAPHGIGANESSFLACSLELWPNGSSMDPQSGLQRVRKSLTVRRLGVPSDTGSATVAAGPGSGASCTLRCRIARVQSSPTSEFFPLAPSAGNM